MASGMMRIAGKGKKRDAERRANHDRGLNEAKGFSPGLMRVSKPDPASERSGSGHVFALNIASSRGGRGRRKPGGRGPGRKGGSGSDRKGGRR